MELSMQQIQENPEKKKQKWYIERFAGPGSNWAIYRNKHDRQPIMGIVRFTGEDGFTEQFDAFAQLVDRAVNNHDALVEALRLVVTRYDISRDVHWRQLGLPRPQDDDNDTIRAARSALAAAKE